MEAATIKHCARRACLGMARNQRYFFIWQMPLARFLPV